MPSASIALIRTTLGQPTGPRRGRAMKTPVPSAELNSDQRFPEPPPLRDRSRPGRDQRTHSAGETIRDCGWEPESEGGL